MTAPDEAMIEAVAEAICEADTYFWFEATDERKKWSRAQARAALAVATPVIEQRFLDRLIAKAAQEGIVFVSDGHFGRAKRIQDWLRAQHPVEGGE